MTRREDARGAGAVIVALVALALARAVTSVVPSMWAWGLNVQRFLDPLPAALTWITMAALIVPALGRRANPALERAGDRLFAGGVWTWLAALAAAGLVWALPDRTWLTGDFLLRQGAAETGALPGIFTQSLPLERWLNQSLPLALGRVLRIEPALVTRALEAAAAAALGATALALARECRLGGSAGLVAAGSVLFGGALCFFTGLGKPAALLCVLTATTLLAALRLARTGRGGAWLGGSVAIALLLHRSALALLPLWIAALIASMRAPRQGRPRLAPAVALPLVALVAMAPRLWRILMTFDLPRHVQPGGTGVLALAFAPLHLVDLVNLVLFLAPALVILAALAAAGPHAERDPADRARWLPGLLALTFVPLLLFVHPLQGVFRDLEVFAPAGIACAAVAGLACGAALQRGRLPSWLAPALLAAVTMPALQWLLHFHDPVRGDARARALALEAPVRTEVERARLWDVLAYRAFRERQWSRAVEACEQTVRLAPHPRAITMLAIARTYTGDYRGAESLYVALTSRTPDDPLVWFGLGGAALRTGDSAQVSRARAVLDGYAPDSREARLIRRHLRMFPEVWPTRAGSGP